MNKWKLGLKTALYIVYSGISGFFTPSFLLVTFNFTDGIQNNPEGEWFVPFGIFMLFIMLVIDIWIILRIVMSQGMDKRQKALTLSLFIIAKVGFTMLNQLDLQLFIECFRWKLEHQWLR